MAFFKQQKIILALALGLTTVGLLSCGIGSSNLGTSIVTQCIIPSDQKGTISGSWKSTPIPIAFFQGSFSSAEMSTITSAADTWNTFFNASKGISVISYGSGPTTSSANNPALSNTLCSQTMINGTQFTGNAVIYKPNQWPYASSAIALTDFCTTPSTPYNVMYMAVIMLNVIDFWGSGQEKPDLKSILTHEFGHLLGLNHTGPNPGYSNAIMFATFSFDSLGAGQVKQALSSDDEERANCLYPTQQQ